MKRDSVVLKSDEEIIKDVKYILSTGDQDTIRTLKMNIFSYLELVRILRDKKDRVVMDRRNNLSLINGGIAGIKNNANLIAEVAP
jgi:hypothetical protein